MGFCVYDVVLMLLFYFLSSVYCYWRFAYINVLTIAAMFFFAANTDVPLSAATITTTQKNIVTYIVVIKLPQF